MGGQPVYQSWQMNEYRSSDMPDDYVVVDTETTGLFATDRIIEIGAIRVRNCAVVASFEKLVNPGIPISPGASKVNGITNSMVKHGPSFSEIQEEFLSFIGDDIIVGHNITFDLKFINRELCRPLQNRYIDTCKLARQYIDDVENHKLATLVDYFGINISQKHRALGDVILTQMVFEKIKGLILEEDFEDLPDQENVLSIKEIANLLLGFDSMLQEYDQMIVDYLSCKTRFKKDLIESAPKIPQNIENSIIRNYRCLHAIDEAQFRRLLSIARKKLNQYRMRESVVMRIEAKTRTIKEPFDFWQNDLRDPEYEQTILVKAEIEKNST